VVQHSFGNAIQAFRGKSDLFWLSQLDHCLPFIYVHGDLFFKKKQIDFWNGVLCGLLLELSGLRFPPLRLFF
jgi:hypothetical protein